MFSPSVFYRHPKAALRWLQQAFGFELTLLVEGPDGDERTLHAQLSFGGEGSLIVGAEWADWIKSPLSVDGHNTQSVKVDLAADIDAHCERARAAGARIVQEPQDQFYGARTYRCVDLEGHYWTFSQHLREVSVPEMEKAGGIRFKSSL